MTRLVPILLLGLALAPATHILAHPEHEHKIMGTVSVLHDNHLEVKGTDGKTSLITMNEKTRIVRGGARVTADAIKTGERVVVMAIETKGKDGKALMVAREVRLAAVAQQPPPQQPKR
jgi:hypothetical protein